MNFVFDRLYKNPYWQAGLEFFKDEISSFL